MLSAAAKRFRHADVAGNGRVTVAQNHPSTLGKMAAEAVSVADGNDGEASWAGGVPALAVADGRAWGDVSQGDNAGLPGEHGANGKNGLIGTGTFALEVVAIKGDARPDHDLATRLCAGHHRDRSEHGIASSIFANVVQTEWEGAGNTRFE